MHGSQVSGAGPGTLRLMARKVFEIEDGTTQPPVEPEFELGGQVFKCVPDTQLSSLEVLDYIAGMVDDNGLARIQTMIKLFATLIREDDEITAVGTLEAGDVPVIVTPSSRDRFRETIRVKRVRLPVLSDIASWLLDEYLRFPTPAPEPPSSNGSTPGASSNGATSSGQPASTSAT